MHALLLAALSTATAQEAPGFLLGDDLRYGQMGAAPRVLSDLVAIPAGMPRRKGENLAIFTAFGVTTLGLMWPTDPLPDVRLDRL